MKFLRTVVLILISAAGGFGASEAKHSFVSARSAAAASTPDVASTVGKDAEAGVPTELVSLITSPSVEPTVPVVKKDDTKKEDTALPPSLPTTPPVVAKKDDKKKEDTVAPPSLPTAPPVVAKKDDTKKEDTVLPPSLPPTVAKKDDKKKEGTVLPPSLPTAPPVVAKKDDKKKEGTVLPPSLPTAPPVVAKKDDKKKVDPVVVAPPVVATPKKVETTTVYREVTEIVLEPRTTTMLICRGRGRPCEEVQQTVMVQVTRKKLVAVEVPVGSTTASTTPPATPVVTGYAPPPQPVYSSAPTNAGCVPCGSGYIQQGGSYQPQQGFGGSNSSCGSNSGGQGQRFVQGQPLRNFGRVLFNCGGNGGFGGRVRGCR